jgi:hypothetical protein
MSDPDTSNDDLRELMQEALDLESEEDWLMEGGDDEKPAPVITLLPDLIELLISKSPGVYNAHPTVKEAGGSKSYAAKLTKLLKADPACPLARDLDRIGVTYVKASEGGYLPAPSVFVKRHVWD